MVTRQLDVSVIVPTYEEAENLPVLIPQIVSTLERADLEYEIILVDDDSQDGTIKIFEQLTEQYALQLITRTSKRGLATAAVCGLRAARGDVLVVMDADLSHPPEAIPKLVKACRASSFDFAIGSRYVPGGSIDSNWSGYRHLNSRVASLLARGLTSAKDPMAGFFAIKKEVFRRAHDIQPLGYKIGLELIVRCHCRHIAEVPIAFKDRALGESKLTVGQQLLYLRHLARLYTAKFLPLAKLRAYLPLGKNTSRKSSLPQPHILRSSGNLTQLPDNHY